MHKESCRLPKINQHGKRRERYEARRDKSTASSRAKSVAVKAGLKSIHHWWARPEFADSLVRCERDPACGSCRQSNEHQLHVLASRRKLPPLMHVLSDFAHRYAKLQRRELKLPKQAKKDSFHGIQASDVTSHLVKSIPRHSCSLDEEAPTEWFGVKSSDVTKVLDLRSRGPRPTSREYSFGIQPTDVTQHTRVVPPSAPPQADEEPREFFGRPKTDVTNFNIRPRRIEDNNCREDELRPLGKPRPPHASHAHRLPLHSPDQSARLKSNSGVEKQMFCVSHPSCRPCHDYNESRGFDANPEFNDTSCGYILSPPVKSFYG